MREIKFRAWVESCRCMDYRGGLTNGEVYSDSPIPTLSKILNNTKGFIFMQSTGLKDVKGKEIYEGDIVECFIGVNNERYVGVCEFNKRTAGFEFGRKKTSNYSRANMTVGRMKKRRVIGNVYQNPELLGDEN